MQTAVTVNAQQVLISLGDLRGRVVDTGAMLRIIGELMRASIARTFREEGSTAGSWPALAESTRKKKGYTAGHKLLVMSGRLFDSISYQQSGNSLIVGTNVIYARVHQLGSADRSGGSIGAQAKISGRGARVSAYDALRVVPFRRYGKDHRTGKDGKTRTVHVRAQGADSATRYRVGGHTRHQNIPARPYLVIRPEDPARFAAGIDSYLGGGSLKVGVA